MESNVAPMLSIAMPSYNVERYIRRGLDSFADERFGGLLEVIIVDDGSTDATADIAREYIDKHPKIFKLVSKANGGHGSAICAGLDAAIGKYFRVVDGDDWVNTDSLIALLEHLENTDADVVVDVRTDVDMHTETRRIRPLPEGAKAVRGTIPFEDVCANDVLANAISIHTLTTKTSLLRDGHMSLPEHTFYVDYEYITKATLEASTIDFVDQDVYCYLVGNEAQSVADSNYVKRWDDHTRVTKDLLALYKSEAAHLSESKRSYLQKKTDLLVNTHYNIALIFDSDRKRGVKRAKEFREFLQSEYPDFAKRGDRRYKQAKLLHYLGVDSQAKLDKLR